MPIGSEPTAEENAALASALLSVHRSGLTNWRPVLTEFLMRHPDTPWRASLLANLGVLYQREHGYARALEAWDQAWIAAKDARDPYGRAVADFAIAEWVSLVASFGLTEQLEERLTTIANRPMTGSAAVKIHRARETAAIIREHPEKTLACGPEALRALYAALQSSAALPAFSSSDFPTTRGSSLSQLLALADQAGLSLQMIARTTARDIPIPSVVHLKIGHFVTVVGRDADRYRIQDRARHQDYWMSQDTLLEETSGYLLTPSGSVPQGWRMVEQKEGDGVVGRGPLCPDAAPPAAPPPEDDDPEDEENPPEEPCDGAGMPVYRLQRLTASLILKDIPAGYTPPRGPSVPLRIDYHQRDVLQPQIFTMANMGPKWTFNWLRYVQESTDAFTGPHVWVTLPPGGREVFANPDAQGTYPAHWHSRAVLVRVSTNPLRYERRLRDGTVEVYGLADGAPSGSQRVFLTEIIDPVGQRLQLTWDAQLRLIALTDALGQVSTITYGNVTDPLKITAVTDPFGRQATFTYNAVGQLTGVTDVIGLTSTFAYGPEDFVSTLTTPYGVTTFRNEPGSLSNSFRFIEATDALGGTERVEFQFYTPTLSATAPASEVPSGFSGFNTNLNYFNTFYWSKRAWALGKGDLTKAYQTHWLMAEEWDGWQKYSALPHSVKRPLEGRVWYAYPGQPSEGSTSVGWWRRASRVGRVMDDGTSQIVERTYNDQGHLTSVMDPLGRRTSYTYASNGIDLLEVRQTTGAMNDLLATYANYTTGHLPQSVTDAAGQVTSVTYNSTGQVLTVTNSKQETTTYAYDSSGYLTTLTGAVTGAVSTITRDGYGRPRTVTGPDGYSVTVDYDLFDRPTRVSYPDGTYEESTYDRLDLSTTRDRAGRMTRYFHDPLRRLTATRDPLGRTVTLERCACGALDAVVDPNGNRTSWERDLQGRVTREVRANSTATSYVYATKSSRLVRRTDAKGQDTTYEYFLDGQLQQVSYSNAVVATPSVSLTYDASYGRLATMVDGIGTTTYTYRPVGQLGAEGVESIDGPLADDTLTYGYDELGRVVSRTLNGATSTWVYDGLGRLASQGDPIGTFTYAYDGATGRLTNLTYPNGQTSTYTYFPNAGDRRLQEIHHQTSAGGTLSRFAYTYDAVGNISTWTQQYDTTARAYDFTYDAADQLIGAVYRTTDPTPTVLKQYGYVYDSVGNRTTEQIDDAPRTWTYDTMNRLTSQAGGGLLTFAGTVSEPATVTVQARPAVVDGTNRFSSTAVVGTGTNAVTVTATDATGNTANSDYEVDISAASETLTYDATGNLATQGTRTYEWDAVNRLTAVNSGTHRTDFSYDGLDRRVRITEKENGAVVRDAHMVWDGADILEERVATGDVNRFFAHAELHNSTARYLTRDHLGSIREVTDGAGGIVTRNDYDPYGRVTRIAGIEDSLSAFTGLMHHASTGLSFAQYRTYDAEIGRWLSEDPVGGVDGPNLYAYVRGNPVAFADLSGLELVPVTLPGIGNTYLDSSFAPYVDAFIAGARQRGVEPHFNSAYRPVDVQEALKNNPNAITPASVSLHSAGFAFDVNFSSRSAAEQQSLKEAAEEAGLLWGGTFKRPDPPHFYYDPLPRKPGESLKEWRARRQKLVEQATQRYNEFNRLNKDGRCGIK